MPSPQGHPQPQRRPQGLKPLKFFAEGNKLQCSSTEWSEASSLHGAKHAEDLAALESRPAAKPASAEQSMEDLREVVIDDLCQCFELRRIRDGVGDMLQGKDCHVFLPHAAERLNSHRRIQLSVKSRSKKLELSGRPLKATNRRTLHNDAEVHADHEAVVEVSPGLENADCQAGAARRPRSRSGSHGRLIFTGRGASPSSGRPKDCSVGEIAAKMGVDIPAPNKVVKDRKVASRPKKVKAPEHHVKRCLIPFSPDDAKSALEESTKREHDAQLLSPDSLGLWASQVPLVSSTAVEDQPMEAGISRSILRDISTTSVPFSQASLRVAKGRPPMSRSLSMPMAGDSSLNYVDICQRSAMGHEARQLVSLVDVTNGEGLETATEAAYPKTDLPLNKRELLLGSGMTTPTRAGSSAPESVSSMSTPLPRPSTTGSSMPTSTAKNKQSLCRGMPLGAGRNVMLSGGASYSAAGNLFGLVSRSHNFSQGSPTDLGPALATSASSASQVPSVRSKQTASVRSSSSTGRLCSGSCPGAEATHSGMLGRGLPN